MKAIYKNVVAAMIAFFPLCCQAESSLPCRLLAKQVNGKIYVPSGSVVIAPDSINIHIEDALVPVLSIHVDDQGIYVVAAELRRLINNPYYMRKFIQERQIIISSPDMYPAQGYEGYPCESCPEGY